mmetsp:Transcript_50848/g.99457  ORF Transcript_50848/g.99457 Transcript_50848/m.99457 type:complete len:200 (-) Transcript_50848:129-728(-)|eukprot:CAMPEP_0194307724 /NCGR_PEP_ID=MMETSP0171-20130528/4623_1 /TAXON_ID=218684 /ORGANISM="Corethron pennatum, Strain L29A3" /LENGTH=199 /DNA_ID=CAMNT_0039059943 /DNA_START=18 /DNA_END=617 /DNA_ORIENTATION=-
MREMMKCASVALLLLGYAGAYTGSTAPVFGGSSGNDRRQILQRGLAVSSSVLAPWWTALVAPPPAAAAGSENLRTLQQTSAALQQCTAQTDLFLRGLVSVDPLPDAPRLPPQISLRVFQGLAPRAKNVPARNFEADDFLGTAAEYAEHAGSARDYAKLAQLGRIGENGSEEVAVFYAKKAAEELVETEKTLQILVLAVQ